MKKLSDLKNIQLAVTGALATAAVFLLLRKEVRQFVFSTVPGTLLFLVVWMLLATAFVFLLLEYRLLKTVKGDYRELYEAAYIDAVSGLPNRYSCDAMLRKCTEEGTPESLGCAMVDLVNLPEINMEYGYEAGNELLRTFAKILLTAAPALCFVGRDGGEKFLAVFRDCAKGNPAEFLVRLDEEIKRHNTTPDAVPIVYRTGVSQNSAEHLEQASALAALANRRIYGDPCRE